MKVFFKHLIHGYTGRADNLVIYYNRRLNRYIIRQLPHRRITQSNLDFAAITQNLKRLNPSPAYRDDFKVYCDQYSRLKENEDRPVPSWYNLFVRMMYALADKYPAVDLKTIDRAFINAFSLPCKTLKDAIEDGLLPPVLNFQRLDSAI